MNIQHICHIVGGAGAGHGAVPRGRGGGLLRRKGEASRRAGDLCYYLRTCGPVAASLGPSDLMNPALESLFLKLSS